MDQLKSFEIELHQHFIRKNSKRVSALLHPDYIEIGYSGSTYDLKSILDSIRELPSDVEIWSQNYEYIEYASGVVQVIYLSANAARNGTLSRHAKRTSIWINASGTWQMKFHQATPVAEFEKTSN